MKKAQFDVLNHLTRYFIERENLFLKKGHETKQNKDKGEINEKFK